MSGGRVSEVIKLVPLLSDAHSHFASAHASPLSAPESLFTLVWLLHAQAAASEEEQGALVELLLELMGMCDLAACFRRDECVSNSIGLWGEFNIISRRRTYQNSSPFTRSKCPPPAHRRIRCAHWLHWFAPSLGTDSCVLR